MASTQEMQRRAKAARQAQKAVRVKTMSPAFQSVLKEMHSDQWKKASGKDLMQQGIVWARRMAACPEHEKAAFTSIFFKM